MTYKPMSMKCVADVCVVPIGTVSVSGSSTIAKVQLFIKKSGLKHSLHSAGTTIEGDWDQVMNLIGQVHVFLHEEGTTRLHSDIRIGTRLGDPLTIEGESLNK